MGYNLLTCLWSMSHLFTIARLNKFTNRFDDVFAFGGWILCANEKKLSNKFIGIKCVWIYGLPKGLWISPPKHTAHQENVVVRLTFPKHCLKYFHSSLINLTFRSNIRWVHENCLWKKEISIWTFSRWTILHDFFLESEANVRLNQNKIHIIRWMLVRWFERIFCLIVVAWQPTEKITFCYRSSFRFELNLPDELNERTLFT